MNPTSPRVSMTQSNLHKRWLAWRKDHLKTCASYPAGICCELCHGNDNLEMFDIAKDVVYVCCGKRIGNLIGLAGKASVSNYKLRNGLSTYKPKHSPDKVNKLPDGLLKSWLLRQLL